MSDVMIVNVANDFSRFPAGRYLSDGPYSGEGFLLNHLVPALEKANKVKVVLDGTLGYGSSFLEEAFGGLVRLQRWSLSELQSRMELVSEQEPALLREIDVYMTQAQN